MNIEEKDIISLDDNNNYSVVKIIELPSNKKVYLLADIRDLTNQKFMYLKEDNKLIEIEDSELISNLKNTIVSNPNNITEEINKSLEIIDSLID